MRVGGPADLFAEVRNLFELRGIVRFARSRDIPLFLIGRGSDLVISDAGIGGLVVVVRAAGVRVEGERLIAEAGLPDGQGWRPPAKARGPVGARVRAGHPGHRRRRRVGQRRRPRRPTCRASWSRPWWSGPTARSARSGPSELGMAYRETHLKHSAPGRPDVVLQATFALEPADPDTIAARLD